ncbi:MAG: CRISPR-associated endonuclease Cas1 [Planctomycetes bacterium]|nr:CRISPR-associated endonuclease Cas1 [Planctomycetota bacterium]
MVNEVIYCPRRFYLEWVDGEWVANAYMEDGIHVHRRADRETAGPPPAGDSEAPPFVARSVSASSPRLGLSMRADVVEGTGGDVEPVEYKRGKPPKNLLRAYDPERVQVCAQALILRDHGYRLERGFIYYAASRERVEVALDDDLVQLTLDAIARAREIAARREPPPPLVSSPKCDGCSLVGVCLPDEVNQLRARPTADVSPSSPSAEALAGTGSAIGELVSDAEAAAFPRIRGLTPARDDAVPLYVQRGGYRVGLRGDVLEVRDREHKTIGEARLEHTSHVAVFGGVQVTTQALRALLERDVPLAVYSAGGWFYGWARGLSGTNVELRRVQFRAADDPARSLAIARGIVAGKISNQRTILRRNHPEKPAELERLADLARQAGSAGDLGSLLGIEGTAARLYFGRFPELLKVALGPSFDFEGRSRRPPQDPINALLSFVYALLTKDWTITCALVGFDPYVGFLHQPRFGRPSLALDLMEEFRPIIADSVVLGAVNGGVVGPSDFVRRGLGVSLTDAARRRMISAYERRMDELVTHPTFGYRISYRRVLEVQARLFARHLMGELPELPTFRRR